MDFLGIGPLELIFILIIALIVLGPNDMVKAGRTVGRFLRKIVMSPTWRTLQDASKEIRYLPNRLIREAGLDELENELPKIKEIQQELQIDQLESEIKTVQHDLSAWTTEPTIGSPETPLETPGNNNVSSESIKNSEQE